MPRCAAGGGEWLLHRLQPATSSTSIGPAAELLDRTEESGDEVLPDGRSSGACSRSARVAWTRTHENDATRYGLTWREGTDLERVREGIPPLA